MPYDFAKAFDSIPIEVRTTNGGEGYAWQIARKMGMPRQLVALSQDLHSSLVKRFKYAGASLGPPARVNRLRGVVQGDPASMIAMDITTAIWYAAAYKGSGSGALSQQAAVATGCWGQEGINNAKCNQVSSGPAPEHRWRAGGYLDDLHTLAHESKTIVRIHDISLLWAAALDVKFDAKTSVVFGPAEREEELQLCVAQDRIPFDQKAGLLGACVCGGAVGSFGWAARWQDAAMREGSRPNSSHWAVCTGPG